MTNETILRIDASARRTGSVSREIGDSVLAAHPDATVVTRDLAVTPLSQIDETWVGANFTPASDRTAEQVEALALSDALVAELQAADTIVLGLPIYNFGVPAGLKAWIDLVARAGVTFRYTETGPVGLLTGKKVIVAYASGGTPLGADYDFASGYLRHVFGFLGIADIAFVTADDLASAA